MQNSRRRNLVPPVKTSPSGSRKSWQHQTSCYFMLQQRPDKLLVVHGYQAERPSHRNASANTVADHYHRRIIVIITGIKMMAIIIAYSPPRGHRATLYSDRWTLPSGPSLSNLWPSGGAEVSAIMLIKSRWARCSREEPRRTRESNERLHRRRVEVAVLVEANLKAPRQRGGNWVACASRNAQLS